MCDGGNVMEPRTRVKKKNIWVSSPHIFLTVFIVAIGVLLHTVIKF